jgi:hypothetical protein
MMGETMTKPKDVKVIVLPPAEQDVFFQEQQFDRGLPGRGCAEGMSNSRKRGTDPIKYLYTKQGDSGRKETLARNANVGLAKSKKKKLRAAEKELEGHQNKDEILKILRSE